MPKRGVDYSIRNDDLQGTAACLKAAGLDFVVRYYDDGSIAKKCLSASEAQALLAAGLEVFTVFETCGGQKAPGCATWYSDYFNAAQGTYDGQAALAAAKAAGQPPDKPIYFAVDYEASLADIAGPITEYFNAVYAVLGGGYPIGVYGGYPICDWAQGHWPAVTHYWQTLAWSGGRELPGIDLYQFQTAETGAAAVCGLRVDNDYGYATGWRLASGTEGDMTADQVRQIVKDYITKEYGPALEAELRQLKGDVVADAVKAVAAKLAQA